jgi:hypothetical protein
LYAFLIPLLQYPHLIFLYIALKTYTYTIHSESGGKKLPVQELRLLVASFSLQKHRYTTDDVALGHICLLVLQFSLYKSFCQCAIFLYIYLPSMLYSLEMDSITNKIKIEKGEKGHFLYDLYMFIRIKPS